MEREDPFKMSIIGRFPELEEDLDSIVSVTNNVMTNKLAGAIAYRVRDAQNPAVCAIGPRCVTIAIHSLATSRKYIDDDKLDFDLSLLCDNRTLTDSAAVFCIHHRRYSAPRDDHSIFIRNEEDGAHLYDDMLDAIHKGKHYICVSTGGMIPCHATIRTLYQLAFELRKMDLGLVFRPSVRRDYPRPSVVGFDLHIETVPMGLVKSAKKSSERGSERSIERDSERGNERNNTRHRSRSRERHHNDHHHHHHHSRRNDEQRSRRRSPTPHAKDKSTPYNNNNNNNSNESDHQDRDRHYADEHHEDLMEHDGDDEIIEEHDHVEHEHHDVQNDDNDDGDDGEVNNGEYEEIIEEEEEEIEEGEEEIDEQEQEEEEMETEEAVNNEEEVIEIIEEVEDEDIIEDNDSEPDGEISSSDEEGAVQE